MNYKKVARSSMSSPLTTKRVREQDTALVCLIEGRIELNFLV